MSENLQVQNQNNKINFKKLQKKLRKNLPVYQETDSYNFRYQEFADRTDEQIKNNHWTWKEIDVAKDKQDFLVEMTEAEKFATSFVLKLFLKYEISIGAEWWADKFMKMFKRPEFQRKAIFNSSQELNIHAPFYNELNKQFKFGFNKIDMDSFEVNELADMRKEANNLLELLIKSRK